MVYVLFFLGLLLGIRVERVVTFMVINMVMGVTIPSTVASKDVKMRVKGMNFNSPPGAPGRCYPSW